MQAYSTTYTISLHSPFCFNYFLDNSSHFYLGSGIRLQSSCLCLPCNMLPCPAHWLRCDLANVVPLLASDCRTIQIFTFWVAKITSMHHHPQTILFLFYSPKLSFPQTIVYHFFILPDNSLWCSWSMNTNCSFSPITLLLSTISSSLLFMEKNYFWHRYTVSTYKALNAKQSHRASGK
jgi:hypothetical protein